MKPLTNWIDYYPIETTTLLSLSKDQHIHYVEECMRFHDLIQMTRKDVKVRKCMNDLLNRIAVLKDAALNYN